MRIIQIEYPEKYEFEMSTHTGGYVMRSKPLSVTARISRTSVKEAVFTRMERMLVVTRRMLRLTAGPGLKTYISSNE